MRKTIQLCLFFLLSFSVLAQEGLSRFFANETIQAKNRKAFVLQAPVEKFLRSMDKNSFLEREEIIKYIHLDRDLTGALKDWEELSISEQIPFLKKIFDIEVKVLKINPPELIFSDKEIPGRAAYFDFDLEGPGAGRVILNPKVLEGMNKYASISLLIHETRHSAQLQMAYGSDLTSEQGRVFREAFKAQKEDLPHSFCDFLTLANEHEAFHFGNYILGRLTDFQVSMPDMGTYATQFDKEGNLKIDLVRLLDDGRPESLLEKFNESELIQCRELGACE